MADVVAAETVAGVPPCIMGTFLEGKSCKQNITQEEQCSHKHTRQMRRGRRGEGGGGVGGAQRGIPFNHFPFFLLHAANQSRASWSRG